MESRSRRPQSLESPQNAGPNEVDWIQPYPDRILDEIASPEAGPDTLVIEKETIELAYLIAIQYVPPRQRAVLILRDALRLSAKETADLLDESVASVNSALARARSVMRKRLPDQSADSQTATSATAAERRLVKRYMDAIDRADVTALAELLREDARLTMPPFPTWFQGREEITRDFVNFTDSSSPSHMGPVRTVATAANRQPAVAAYVRRPGDSEFRPLGIDVLRIEDSLIVEITRFIHAGPPRTPLPVHGGLFAEFELAPTL
jgi:RNA polymerase sigma-70 factor (ECF subfamily)